MKKCLLLCGVFLLSGCATGPVLYPNDHLNIVGQEQAKLDIAECRQLADAYVKTDAAKAAAQDMAVGGAGGAVIGGAMGAVRGGIGRGACIGAAGGAAAGLVGGAIRASEPSPVYKAFVVRCLGEKGYDTIGWQ